MISTTLDGRFRVEDVLSKGVTGGVYRGRDLQTGQQVAIKLLFIPTRADANFGMRFKREAMVLEELDHPNIVHVIQTGQTKDGIMYIAMEFVYGQTLANLLQIKGAQPMAYAVDVIAQVAAALDLAHGKGVIHRDVKPDNVMVAEGDQGRPIVKLIDFGLAKAEELEDGSAPATGRLRLGESAYLSPEQLNGKPPSVASDVHSLAVIAYFLLAGKHPFQDPASEVATISAIMDNPPPPMAAEHHVPKPVEECVRQGLAKRPALRPASAGEFAQKLRAASTASPAAGSGKGTDEHLNTTVKIPVVKWEKPPRAAGRKMPEPPREPDAGKLPVGLLALGLLVLAVAAYAAYRLGVG